MILLDPDGSEGLTAALAARLCDRRSGIGGDGVLRVVRATAHGPARPGGGADGLADAASVPGAGQGSVADGLGDAASRLKGGAHGRGDAAFVPGAGLARPEWFMDYRNADGSIANYIPDFIIKRTDAEIWIIETKGREDLDDPPKWG